MVVPKKKIFKKEATFPRFTVHYQDLEEVITDFEKDKRDKKEQKEHKEWKGAGKTRTCQVNEFCKKWREWDRERLGLKEVWVEKIPEDRQRLV